MAPPQSGATKLYTPRLLSLAADLAGYPFAPPFHHEAQARSRTCGSEIELGVDCDGEGRVARLGMQVTACAVGQASAAVMAKTAQGRTAQDFARALAAIEAWLAGDGPTPEWPGFDALEPALPHSGRHSALMLPWKAMDEALSSSVVTS